MLNVAGRPIKAAMLLRDGLTTADVSPSARPRAEVVTEYMMADCTVRPVGYGLPGEHKMSGVQMAAAAAAGVVSAFMSPMIGLDPLSGYMLGGYISRQAADPSRTGFVGPMLRKMDFKGLVNWGFPEAVQALEPAALPRS